MASLSGRQRIVILGGGCGGVVAATHLGRKLGADHEVILIDRRPDHIFMPAFLFVMLGRAPASRHQPKPQPSSKAQRQSHPVRNPWD